MKKGIVIIITSILSMVISIFLIFLGLFNTDSDNIISYKVDNKVNHKVYLVENKFYDKDYLTNEDTYPLEFINYIEFEFINSFSMSKVLDLKQEYSISAFIEVKDTTKDVDNILLNKEYKLLENENINISSSSNSIRKTVNINYKEYNEFANQYKLKVKVPSEAILKIIMKINTTAEDINDKNEILVSMPLSGNTVSINNLYDETYSDTTVDKVDNMAMIIVSIILFIISLIMIVYSFNQITYNSKNYINIKLKKILSTYEQIIVDIDNIPSFKENNIIIVKYFKDMLDIQRELNEPILHFHKNENSNHKFIIKDNEYLYIYSLNNEKEKI